MLRVLSVGALLYAAGLALMAYTTSPVTLQVTAGVLIGFGLSGCSFNLVIAAFGKLLPERYRTLAIGAGTAAGSFGQFLFAPFGVALIDNAGWQNALLVFGGMLLLILPMALALATPPNSPSQSSTGQPQAQSLTGALVEAFGHRSYVLLVFGFFTCGFQLAFITLHLPAYLIDRGLSAQVGGWALATIGLFNIIGSISVGWLSTIYPRRYLLAINYFLRAVFIAAFVLAAREPGHHAAVRRRHGPDVAFDRAADLGPRLADVRHALARDALRLCVLQPSGRRLPRRVDGWPAVRAHRLLRYCVVARGRVRHIVGGDQSADRGEARAAGRTRRRLIVSVGARGT